jgi:tetratricopeptide (TPR) repeat protein
VQPEEFMKLPVLASVVWLTAAAAFAQHSEAQTQFEAGQFEQALASLGPAIADPAADPASHFLAVQAALRLEQPERAEASLTALAGHAAAEWQLVAQSVQALRAGDMACAVGCAERAAAANPNLFAAHYQHGLALARAEQWADAAAAFERALALDPSFAYAAYYAGLAYSRVNRADKTAEYFERFTRMAPSAPERAGVQSIMRTLRGR